MTSPYNDIVAKHECESCLLCHQAPCTASCPYGQDPARVIRSLRFENFNGAALKAGAEGICIRCEEKSCMKSCLRGKLNRPVDIPALMGYAADIAIKPFPAGKTSLGITFCGIPCENPFFLSSSVVASSYDMVARAFEAGWAGAAFKTVGTFVPEEVSPRFSAITCQGHSFTGFKNIEQISDHTLEENLRTISRLKEAYPHKVIIASILGQDEEEWTELARLMTEAGADVLECNFSCPHMSGDGLGSDVGQNPDLVARYTRATRKGSHLPILAKMTPNIGNMEIPALAAMGSGASGIAAINTIKSIMNIGLNDFVSSPAVDGKSCVGGYSGKAVKPIALRFIHDMLKHPGLKEVPVSGMGGIETWRDAAEFLALGCTNLQITTAVMQFGYRIIEDLIEGLTLYLLEMGFSSVEELVGRALPKLVPADSLNRRSIQYPKIDRNRCIGCGRCYLSCEDGGHQALKQEASGAVPRLEVKSCVGCHLCAIVCPVGAISPGKRVEG